MLDAAITHKGAIEAFLRQPVDEHSDPAEADARLLSLAGSLHASLRASADQIEDAEEVPDPEAPAPDPGLGAAPAIPPLGLSI